MSNDPITELSAALQRDIDRVTAIGYPSKPLQRAMVWLVAGNLNHHLLNCNGDDDPVTEWKPWLGCDGCCPQCCAPCKAMAWLRDNANDALTRWLNDWDPHPNGRWDWQLPDGSVNWGMVERHWKPEQLQCHDEEDLMSDETTDLGDVQAAFNRLPEQLLPHSAEAAVREGYTVTLHNDEMTAEELAEVQARFDASPVAATVAEFLANPSSGVRVKRPERRGSTVPEGYTFTE